MSDSCSSTSQTCPKVSKHTASVSLPVCITPFAITGPAKVKCCGETSIEPFFTNCKDIESNTCEFIVTQKIQIDLPIEFGATVKSGEVFIDCGCSTYCDSDLELE